MTLFACCVARTSSTQDFRLTEMAANEGRAVVVVVNKWDKVDARLWTEARYVEDVRAQLRHVGWATVVCTTAHKGRCGCGCRGGMAGGVRARLCLSTCACTESVRLCACSARASVFEYMCIHGDC